MNIETLEHIEWIHKHRRFFDYYSNKKEVSSITVSPYCKQFTIQVPISKAVEWNDNTYVDGNTYSDGTSKFEYITVTRLKYTLAPDLCLVIEEIAKEDVPPDEVVLLYTLGKIKTSTHSYASTSVSCSL